MNLPSKVLNNAVDELSGLPGVGRKTALRLAMHLLRQSPGVGQALGDAIKDLVDHIQYCKVCHSFSDTEICAICADENRDAGLLCVVEDVRDVLALENTGKYRGYYYVLGGRISPMEGIGPSQLNVSGLGKHLEEKPIRELIFALSATMEGDTTTYYLYKKFKDLVKNFTSIARGISVGDELEYADEISLGRSITNRIPYDEKQ